MAIGALTTPMILLHSGIGVGAQLTLAVKTFLPGNVCMNYEKLYQLPEHYTMFARKIFFSQI